MASLNPSHNPFRHSEGRHAQAIHRPSDEDPSEEPSSSLFPDEPLKTLANDDRHGEAEKRGRREGRQKVRAAMPPLPDLRFEQSYLLSIRPFLTPHPTSTTDKGPVEEEKQTGSLVESSDRDEVFHWGRQVDVNWKMVSWITLRDQLLSPLAQGIFWGFGTLFLGTASAYLRATLYPTSHISKGRITGGSGGSTRTAGGGTAVGDTDGWWRRFVKSWAGGLETAAM